MLTNLDKSREFIKINNKQYASTRTSPESREIKRKLFDLQNNENDNYDKIFQIQKKKKRDSTSYLKEFPGTVTRTLNAIEFRRY